MAGFQTFGAYLKNKREQAAELGQQDMVNYLLRRGQNQFSRLTYGYLETGRRAPQLSADGTMNEIIPMFEIIVKLHQDKHLPTMQAVEARTFFLLAKARIEKKGKKRPNIPLDLWEQIEQHLLSLVTESRQNAIHLVTASSILALEPPDSRRRQELETALREDTSHLLEREQWLSLVSAYPDKDPQVKVGIVQGSMGAGKSHARCLLIQHLVQREDLFLVPYQFLHNESMTAEDHLDKFLATLLSDLTLRATDEGKQKPLAQRIEEVLNTIREMDLKVVILLDDAQEIFPEASAWSPAWHQFFERFIEEPHRATLYMFTRTWAGWDRRKRTFLEEENLPELSTEAGMLIWKRQGFDDVEDDLLLKVCGRCGINPQIIEMTAHQYKRRLFAKQWGKGSMLERHNHKNLNTQSLETLLESESIFSNRLDRTSREALLQIFSNRLSGDTVRLMQCLALAPLGIPFDLLFDHFDYADESFEHLVKASFADLGVATTGRPPLFPW